ncbi:uncharacterized protein [Chamaea fasciata]|uniref:uncharacterized protein n=1 Tax=Chamaea fasciata TaxID=190680 RepID=UPI003369ECE6
MSENSSAKDKAAFYAPLAKHNARPSPEIEKWAQDKWFNLESVIDRICFLQHETKLRFGRNKAISCSVLGACLTAAIENHFKQRNEEETIIDSLQNLVGILQKQLDEERNENHLLQAALRDEYSKNSKNTDSLKEAEEKETPHINEIYPQKELKLVNNCGENCCPHLRPFVKTEYNYISDEDFDLHITTKQIPYSACELAKLKKEYGQLPQKLETEYVFQVSLTGGDRIKLTEQEAGGYWGHGVFLTTGDKCDTWSLTHCAAFWARGINPLERGNPLATVSTPDQLLESVHKAACLWEWTASQEEAMQLRIFEATAHQAFGPIHPTDPFQVEWGFASSGLSRSAGSGELRWELWVVPGMGNVRSPRPGAGDGHCPFAEQGLGALRRRAVGARSARDCAGAGKSERGRAEHQHRGGHGLGGGTARGARRASLLQSPPCDSGAAAGIFGAGRGRRRALQVPPLGQDFVPMRGHLPTVSQ